jgi:hypothetical protein
MGLANQWHVKTDAVVPRREVVGEAGIPLAKGSVKSTDNVLVYMCRKYNLPLAVPIKLAKENKPAWWSMRDWNQWLRPFR